MMPSPITNNIIDVPHVQWAPDIHTHLFSPGQLIKDGFVVNLHKTSCIVKDPANWLLAEIPERGNTYPASLSIIQSSTPFPIVNAINEPMAEDLDERLDRTFIAYTAKTDNDVMRWHQSLGHLNIADLRNLAQNHARGIDIEDDTVGNADCLACIHGKQHKLPFKSGRTCATHIGELVHMDLAGPMETMSYDGKKYFLIIVDDYSRGIWVEALTLKSKAISKICNFV